MLRWDRVIRVGFLFDGKSINSDVHVNVVGRSNLSWCSVTTPSQLHSVTPTFSVLWEAASEPVSVFVVLSNV